MGPRTLWSRSLGAGRLTAAAAACFLGLGAGVLSAQELPAGAGRDVVQSACSTCHSANIVMGRGHSRQEWGEVVNSMIGRGAKIGAADYRTIVDYLAKALPAKAAAPAAAPARPSAATTPSAKAAATPAGRPRRAFGLTVGPDDKMTVDEALADKGKSLYIAECVTCHGPLARGTQRGSDLVRATEVIHDRYGDTLGPFLAKGHQTQSGVATSTFTKAQVLALSHFLHQQLNYTLRSGPYSKVLNVLTGDASAGKKFFEGEGGCTSCHSATGNLKGVSSKFDPPTLQQRMLFPKTINIGNDGPTTVLPTEVTVTAGSEGAVSGQLDKIDDFNVSLRDASGNYHSWKRGPNVKVELKDPYTAHNVLLDKYTDKDIHDLVAYLETLK